MKFDAESVVLAIFAALFIGSGIYVHHLQRRLADEVDVRQAAEARAALCEAQIETLAREANEREQAAAQALAKAQKDAKTAAQRADYELRRAADFPGDDCASAKSRAARWLGERAGGVK